MNIFNKGDIILISRVIDGTEFIRDNDAKTYFVHKKFHWIDYNLKYKCTKDINSRDLDSLKYDEDLYKLIQMI